MKAHLVEYVLSFPEPWSVAPSAAIVEGIHDRAKSLPWSDVQGQGVFDKLAVSLSKIGLMPKKSQWAQTVLMALGSHLPDPDGVSSEALSSADSSWMRLMWMVATPETLNHWQQAWTRDPSWNWGSMVRLSSHDASREEGLSLWWKQATKGTHAHLNQWAPAPLGVIATAWAGEGFMDFLEQQSPFADLSDDQQAECLMACSTPGAARKLLDFHASPAALAQALPYWLNRGQSVQDQKAWQGLVNDNGSPENKLRQTVEMVSKVSLLRAALTALPAEPFQVDGLQAATAHILNALKHASPGYIFRKADAESTLACVGFMTDWQRRVSPNFPDPDSADAFLWPLAAQALCKKANRVDKDHSRLMELLSIPNPPPMAWRHLHAAMAYPLLHEAISAHLQKNALPEDLPLLAKAAAWMIRASQSPGHIARSEWVPELPDGAHPWDAPGAGRLLLQSLTGVERMATHLQAWKNRGLIDSVMSRPQAWARWPMEDVEKLKDWAVDTMGRHPELRSYIEPWRAMAEQTLLRHAMDSTPAVLPSRRGPRI